MGLYSTIRKALKTIDSIGVFPAFDDHIFKPKIDVTDRQQEIIFTKPVYLVKLVAEGCDIYVNFDRPITTDEYTIVWDGTCKLVGRKISKIYVKAPAGLSGILRLEGLLNV